MNAFQHQIPAPMKKQLLVGFGDYTVGALIECLAFLTVTTPTCNAFQTPTQERVAFFDKRLKNIDAAQADHVPADRTEAVAELQRRLPTVSVTFDELVGAPKFVAARDGFLTGLEGRGRGVPDAGVAGVRGDDPDRAIKAFLAEHRALFRHGPEALERARVQRQFVTAHNGMRTVVWQQEVQGIAVFEALLVAHTTSRGELVNVASQFMADPEQAAMTNAPQRTAKVAQPDIPAEQALRLAAQTTGDQIESAAIEPAGPPEGPARLQSLKAGGLPGEVWVRLVWLPMSSDHLRLCWQVI